MTFHMSPKKMKILQISMRKFFGIIFVMCCTLSLAFAGIYKNFKLSIDGIKAGQTTTNDALALLGPPRSSIKHEMPLKAMEGFVNGWRSNGLSEAEIQILKKRNERTEIWSYFLNCAKPVRIISGSTNAVFEANKIVLTLIFGSDGLLIQKNVGVISRGNGCGNNNLRYVRQPPK